jgi:uncharacterized protein (DUF1501 family)
MAHTRRQFIKRGITFVGAGLAAPRLLLGPNGAATRAQAAAAGRILVIVELEGGNDGLNTVVPYTNSLYYNYRPGLALREGQYVEITDSLGLHGRMGRLKELYDANRVAIVQGVGYPNPDRSHFRSTEIWQTAQPDTVGTTGWLGRYLDATRGEADSELEAISLGYFTPMTLKATEATPAAVASVEDYAFQPDPYHPEDEANKRAAFLGLNDDLRGGGSALDFIATTGLTAFSSSETIRDATTSYDPAAEYPADVYGFGDSLMLVAQMIDAGLGTNIFYTSLGSFDTHANQREMHAYLLETLSNGLYAFYQDLVAHGHADDVLVVTFSEFGRRVDENSSDGTDHGAAAPLFALGNAVQGGIYGDHPSLTRLGDGDLIHGIDFRSVYATVLKHWLDADPEAILGGRFEDIGFVSAPPAARSARERAPKRAAEPRGPATVAEMERRARDAFRVPVPPVLPKY